MVKKQSDYRSVDGSSNKVPTTKEASAEPSGLRRSLRENAWGKQPNSFSKTRINKLDVPKLQTKFIPVETPSPLRRSGKNQEVTLLNTSNLSNKKDPSPLEKPVTRQGLLNISMEKSKEVSPKSQIKDPATSVGMKRKRMDSRSYKALFSLEDRSVISVGKSGADSRAGDTAIASEQGRDARQITQSEIVNNAGVLKGREETEKQGEFSTSDANTQIKKVASNVLNDGQPNICLACNIDGKLLCCSGKDCNRSYHPLCLDPPLNEIPPGDWLCPSCMKKVELGVHSVNQEVESFWDVRDIEIEVPGADGLQDSSGQPEKDNIFEHHKLPSLHNSSNADKNGPATVLEVNHGELEESLSHSILHDFKSVSSKYVEYWAPVSISTVQLEQYSAILHANLISLRSSSKNDLDSMHDILVSTRKCCDHPYAVDPLLQGLLVKGRSPPEYLDVGIKASGKLQLLDTMLSEIRNKGLRVLILFQYISGSGRSIIGDILEDFLWQRFGQDSYERVDGGLPQHKKQAVVNKFNDKNSNRFVFLLEIRACQSSIKLSAVDGIILFDSDWNPSLDLKALNRMFVESSLKQIKIFRLYSPFTLEEKVLILATQNVTLDNSLHNINRSTSHQLLKWGASYLFKKLDLFHDTDTACSDISLEASILKDVAHEILGLLCSQDEVHLDSSLIVKVKHDEGTYSKNNQLLGERELLNVLDESQHFWANLLDGRSPKWKYPSGLLQRNRKKVNYSDEPDDVSNNGELHGGKKRKKTDNIPISPSPELGRNEIEPIKKCGGDSGGLQPAESSKEAASDMKQNFHLLLKSDIEKVYEVLQLPDDVKIMAGELLDYIIDNYHISREPESIFQAFQISLCWNAASLVKNKIFKDQSLAMVKKHLNFSCTEEEANHSYSKMRNLRKKFLEHTNSLKEPKYLKDVVSITDNCPIDLPLVERGACHLQALNAQNAETEILSPRLKQLYAELLHNFLKQCPTEKRVERHFEKIGKNFEMHLTRFLVQQQEEIHDLKKEMEQKREEINAEHRLRVAVIRNIHGKISARSDKLKKIEEEDLSRRMEEYQQQKDICLKELEAKHAGERLVEMKRAIDKFEKLESSSHDVFPGDLALHRLEHAVVGEHVLPIGSESASSCEKEQNDETCSTSEVPKSVPSEPTTYVDGQSNKASGFSIQPNMDICSSRQLKTTSVQVEGSVVRPQETTQTPVTHQPVNMLGLLAVQNQPSEHVAVGGHVVLPIGSESASCAEDQNDKTCSTADKPKSVSSKRTTCVDDQSNIQLFNGAVGFTMKPRGNSDVDIFPGVINREFEQQPHCSSADTTGRFERPNLEMDICSSSQFMTTSVQVEGSVVQSQETTQTPIIHQPVNILGLLTVQNQPSEHVAVGEHVVLPIGSKSASCAEDQNDKACSTSDKPKSVSSKSTTCVDDQSNIQLVNGAVGFTMKPRGNSDVDIFPGVVNRELEQQSHCSSADTTSNLERPNIEMEICSSSQLMTTSAQVEGSVVRHQETTQTPIVHQLVNMVGLPTIQNQPSIHEPSSAELLHQQYEGITGEPPEQLRTVRGLRSIPSGNAFPLRQGTQLPMLTAQSMTSARPNHHFYGDIFHIEQEKLAKKIEQVKKSLNDERAELESYRAKELEEINQKYNAKIYEAETKAASNVKELEMSRHKVLKSKHLSDAFLFKWVDFQYGLLSTSNMQQSTRSLGRLSTDASVSTPVLTNCEISTAPRLLRPLISNMPPQAPPQVVSLPNHMINLQVGGDIRAPAPHLRFRPSYPPAPAPAPAPALYTRPVRADVNESPSRCQNSPLTVGSVANTDNRLGLQTPAGFPSANPITSSGFASTRPISQASFASARPINPASFASSRPICPASFASTRPISPASFASARPSMTSPLYASALPSIPPSGFVSPHPVTSAVYSSAHPILPLSQTEFGVAVQAMNDIQSVEAPEVICLSDDGDDDN